MPRKPSAPNRPAKAPAVAEDPAPYAAECRAGSPNPAAKPATAAGKTDKAGRPDIDSFEAVLMREGCEKGFFVSFDYSTDAEREADAFFRRTGKSIVLFTVDDILNEQLARKLA